MRKNNSRGADHMNVVVAGAFGHLGSDIVRSALKKGHKVIGFGRTVRPIPECEGL